MIYKVGGIVETKKPHACGGKLWEIVRTGADIKLKCQTCGKCVFVSYDKLEKMKKNYSEMKENDGTL